MIKQCIFDMFIPSTLQKLYLFLICINYICALHSSYPQSKAPIAYCIDDALLLVWGEHPISPFSNLNISEEQLTKPIPSDIGLIFHHCPAIRYIWGNWLHSVVCISPHGNHSSAFVATLKTQPSSSTTFLQPAMKLLFNAEIKIFLFFYV